MRKLKDFQLVLTCVTVFLSSNSYASGNCVFTDLGVDSGTFARHYIADCGFSSSAETNDPAADFASHITSPTCVTTLIGGTPFIGSGSYSSGVFLISASYRCDVCSFTRTYTAFYNCALNPYPTNNPPPLPDPKNLGSPPDSCDKIPSCSEGNPINAATGNKFQMETDYVGIGSNSLELRRYYNSQDYSSSAFGAKWHSTYHRGLTQSNSTTVAVTRADGRVNTFNLVAGIWTGDVDVTNKLTAITDRKGKQTGWKLLTEDDASEAYSLDGRLLSITSRAGLVTQLSYDASNRLTQVKAPFGQTLIFSFDTAGHVAQVTLPDGNIYVGSICVLRSFDKMVGWKLQS